MITVFDHYCGRSGFKVINKSRSTISIEGGRVVFKGKAFYPLIILSIVGILFISACAGAAGSAGSAGSDGAAGAAGPAGAAGAAGATGPAGPAGSDGAKGSTGADANSTAADVSVSVGRNIPGQETLAVTVSGFDRRDVVTLTITESGGPGNNHIVGTVTVSASGAGTATLGSADSLAIPSGLATGVYTLKAEGARNGATASTALSVFATLLPDPITGE